MKFMLLMNVKPGPYHIGKWAPEDVTPMINYMHQLNKDLKAKGQFVAPRSSPATRRDSSRRTMTAVLSSPMAPMPSRRNSSPVSGWSKSIVLTRRTALPHAPQRSLALAASR